MIQALRAVVIFIYYSIPVNSAEIEYADTKYCPVVKPCYTPLLYDIKYRCALDEVCPEGYKCCRSDCYIHRVCVVAVNKNGEKIPPPIQLSSSNTYPTTHNLSEGTTEIDYSSSDSQIHTTLISTSFSYITITEPKATADVTDDSSTTIHQVPPETQTVATKLGDTTTSLASTISTNEATYTTDPPVTTPNDNETSTYPPENYVSVTENSDETTFRNANSGEVTTTITTNTITTTSDAIEGSGEPFIDSERGSADDQDDTEGSGDDEDDREGSGDDNIEGSGIPDLITRKPSKYDDDSEITATSVDITEAYVEFTSSFEVVSNETHDDKTANQSTTTLDSSTIFMDLTVTNWNDTEPSKYSTSTTVLPDLTSTQEPSTSESDGVTVMEGSGDELTDTEPDDDEGELTSVGNWFTGTEAQSVGETSTIFMNNSVPSDDFSFATVTKLHLTDTTMESTILVPSLYDHFTSTTSPLLLLHVTTSIDHEGDQNNSVGKIEGSGYHLTDTEPDDNESELTSVRNLFSEIVDQSVPPITDFFISSEDFSFATLTKSPSLFANVTSIPSSSIDDSDKYEGNQTNVAGTNEIEGSGYDLTDAESDDEGELTTVSSNLFSETVIANTRSTDSSVSQDDFSFTSVTKLQLPGTNLSTISIPFDNSTSATQSVFVNVAATSVEGEGSGYEFTDTEPDDDEEELTTVLVQDGSKVTLSENTSGALLVHFTTDTPKFHLRPYPVSSNDNLTYEEEEDEEDGDGVDEEIRNNFQSRIARG